MQSPLFMDCILWKVLVKMPTAFGQFYQTDDRNCIQFRFSGLPDGTLHLQSFNWKQTFGNWISSFGLYINPFSIGRFDTIKAYPLPHSA